MYKKRRSINSRRFLGLGILAIALMTIIAAFITLSPKFVFDAIKKSKFQYSALLDVNKNTQADISKYYIYGTHFNLCGSLQLDLNSNVENATLVFRNVSGEEIEFPLIYERIDNNVNFTTSEKINTGISLEDISNADYYALLKITYAKDENTKINVADNNDKDSYDNIRYYSLLDKSDDLPMTYYTVTKNSSNNMVEIGFELIQMEEFKLSVMNVKSKECELPNDVYDIVIDPGHGGSDGGTVNGEYTEANIVLDIALKLKDEFEKLGLKVKLTRDGTEDASIPMAYTMYDDDGRVNIAGDSKAKLCISLHLNSYDGDIASGGLQVYCPYNVDTVFADTMVNEIVEKANTYASNMEAHSIKDGIYCRTFDENDIEANASSANKSGYEPYDLDTTVNYYYIIRELGGKITGAYTDGRNQNYGKNKYFDSNIGIESYLLEIGYISYDEDLNNILTNKSGYVNGIVNAILKQFSLSQ